MAVEEEQERTEGVAVRLRQVEAEVVLLSPDIHRTMLARFTIRYLVAKDLPILLLRQMVVVVVAVVELLAI